MSEGIRRARSVQLKYLATLHQIGKPLEEPIVGRHFKLPERPRPADHPIPIYCHLVLHPPAEIVRPPTPELITRARMEKAVESWMD
uniref:Uncharacterized protein n=1 Tax=Anopheles farauti TaxID=69004 RepID=A0A182Q848_9DIPT